MPFRISFRKLNYKAVVATLHVLRPLNSPSVKIQTLNWIDWSRSNLDYCFALRLARSQSPYWLLLVREPELLVSIWTVGRLGADFETNRKPATRREQQFRIFQFQITTSRISSRIYAFLAFIGGKSAHDFHGLIRNPRELRSPVATRLSQNETNWERTKKACGSHQPDYKPWAKMATVQIALNWCHGVIEVKAALI